MKMKGSTMETKEVLILLISLNLISTLSAQTGSSFFYYYSPNQPMVVNSQTYGSNPQAHHNVIPTSSPSNPFNSNFQRQPSQNAFPTASPFVPQRSNYHQTYPQQPQPLPSYYSPSGPSILDKFGFTTAPSVVPSQQSQNYYSPQQSFSNNPPSTEQQSQTPSRFPGQPQPSAKLFNFLNQPFQFFQNNFDRFSSQSQQQVPQNQQNLPYRPVTPNQQVVPQPGQGFGGQNQQYFYNYYNNAGARPTAAETAAPTTAEPESEVENGIAGVGNPPRSYYNRGTPGTYSVKQYFSSTGQSPTSYSFNIDSSPTTGPTATVQVNMGQNSPTDPENSSGDNPSRPLRFIPSRFSNRVTVPVERRPEEPSDDLPLEGVPILEAGGQDLEGSPEDIPLPQDEYKSVTTEGAVVEVQMSTTSTTTTAAPPPAETAEEEEDDHKTEVKSTETVPSTTATTTTTTRSEPVPETILTTTVITTTTTTTIKPVVVAKVDSERRTRKRILIRKKIARKRIGFDQNGNKIPEPEEDVSKYLERRPEYGGSRKPTPLQTTTQRPRHRTRKPGSFTTTSTPSTTTTPRTIAKTTTEAAHPVEPITTESSPITSRSTSTEPPIDDTYYEDLEDEKVSEKVPSSSTSINLQQEETTEPNILTTATTQAQPQFFDDSATATLAPLITTTNVAETTGATLLDEESTTTSTLLNKQSHQSANNPSSTEKSFSSYDGDDDYYEYYYDGETPSPKDISVVSSTESSTQQNVFATTPTTTTTTGSRENEDEVSLNNDKKSEGGNEDVDGDLQEISSTALPLYEEEVIEPLSTTESPKATSSTEGSLEVKSTTQETREGQEGSSTEGKGHEGASTEGRGQEGSSTEGKSQDGSSTEGQDKAEVTSQPPLGLTTEKAVKSEETQSSVSGKVPEEEQEVVTKISTEVSGDTDLPDFDYGVVVEAEQIRNQTGQVSENVDKNSQDPAQGIGFPEEYFDPQEEYPINFKDDDIIENQRQGLVNALINIRNRLNSSSTTTTTPKADEDDSPKFVRRPTKVSAFPSASSSPTLDSNNYDDEEIGGDSRSKILQKIQTFKTKLRRVGGQRAISTDVSANQIRSTTKRPRRVTRPSAGSSTSTTSSTELPPLSIADGVESGANEVEAEATLSSTTSEPKFRSSTTTTTTTTTAATTTSPPLPTSQNQGEDARDIPVPKEDRIDLSESSTNSPKTKKRFRSSTSTTTTSQTTTTTTSSPLPKINEAETNEGSADSPPSSKNSTLLIGELIIREILPTTPTPIVIITTPQDDTLDEENIFDENTDFETGSAENESGSTSKIQVVTEVNFSISSSSGNKTSENFKLSGFQNNSQDSQLPNELSTSATFESTTLQTAESSTQRKVKVILKRRKGAAPGSGTVARQVVRTRTRVRPKTPRPA